MFNIIYNRGRFPLKPPLRVETGELTVEGLRVGTGELTVEGLRVGTGELTLRNNQYKTWVECLNVGVIGGLRPPTTEWVF